MHENVFSSLDESVYCPVGTRNISSRLHMWILLIQSLFLQNLQNKKFINKIITETSLVKEKENIHGCYLKTRSILLMNVNNLIDLSSNGKVMFEFVMTILGTRSYLYFATSKS